MRLINIAFVILASAALIVTSEVTLIRYCNRKIDDADAMFYQFSTRLSTVIDPQPEVRSFLLASIESSQDEVGGLVISE
jgi:hypothetical protein